MISSAGGTAITDVLNPWNGLNCHPFHSFISLIEFDSISCPPRHRPQQNDQGMIDADVHIFFFLPWFVVRITDAEAVGMARFLVERDGLFVGSSSACNLVATVKYVKKMGWENGQTIVTIL